jgi:hypothetical protein
MGAIETAKLDLKMIFLDLRLSVNYYYPPDGSFAAANGKNLLDELRVSSFLEDVMEICVGRIFKPTSPLK